MKENLVCTKKKNMKSVAGNVVLNTRVWRLKAWKTQCEWKINLEKEWLNIFLFVPCIFSLFFSLFIANKEPTSSQFLFQPKRTSSLVFGEHFRAISLANPVIHCIPKTAVHLSKKKQLFHTPPPFFFFVICVIKQDWREKTQCKISF